MFCSMRAMSFWSFAMSLSRDRTRRSLVAGDNGNRVSEDAGAMRGADGGLKDDDGIGCHVAGGGTDDDCVIGGVE